MTLSTRTRCRNPLALLAALLAFTSPSAFAEEDPFRGALFPPELVLGHVEELGIDSGQIAAIKEEIRRVQPVFLDRQLDLQTELGRLRTLLEAARPDEDAVLAQLDRILELEREVKRAQIALLVRIKSVLGPEQQDRLRALRSGE